MTGHRPDDSPYPAIMYSWDHPPVEVGDDEFVSQGDAGRTLRAPPHFIGLMIAEGRLRPATRAGQAGVTRTSLAEEQARRQKRFWRLRAVARRLWHFASP